MKRLISGSTFFYKYVFPLGMASLFIASGSIGMAQNPSEFWLFWAAWMAVPAVLWVAFFFWPLKRVWLTDDGLIVSNFWTEIAVPFAAIQSVAQWSFSRPPCVLVHLWKTTKFGRKFIFVSQGWGQLGWAQSLEQDSIVDRIRQQVDAAQDAGISKAPPESKTRSQQSVMADDELDGPF